MRSVNLLTMAVWLLAALPAPATPDNLARTILTLAGGSTNGICSVPRCGTGSLAIGLATNSGFIVHAMDAADGNVATARAAAGYLLGQRIYVEKGGPAAIPLASESVDLLVLADLTDADLTGALTNEILRVISPVVGRAIIGGPAATNLASWVSNVQTNADGVWCILRRGPLPGGEDWTHVLHGPDNNAVTKDSAFTMPSQVSWLGRPYQADWRNVGGRLIADGRVYFAQGANDPFLFQAFNLYNGTVLWSRPLSTNTWAQRSFAAVATNNQVFLLQDGRVDILDAVTGTNTTSLTFTNTTGQHAKWLGASAGLLVTLFGPQDTKDTGWSPGASIYNLRDTKQLGYGQLVIAYDLATAQEKWRQDEGAPIDHRTLAIAGGRILYHCSDARAVCRDLQTGALVWTNADPVVEALIDSKRGPSNWWGMVDGALGNGPSAARLEDRAAVLATSNAFYIGKPEGSNFVALAAATGDLLWSTPRKGGRVFNFLQTGTNLYLDGLTQFGGGYLLNPLTGATNASADAGGCGTPTANSRYLIGQVGGPSFDLTRMASFDGAYPVKAECSIGNAIGGGRFVSLPRSCTCRGARGAMGLGPGTIYGTTTGRLETATGNFTTVAALPADARDWPTHRGASQRTGASAVTAPTSVTNLWTTAARFPGQVWGTNQNYRTVQHALTEPVTVGGRVFVAGSDGWVQCLDAANGLLRWQYWCEGPVLATPTVADGRLFVTSADSWVYVLEAVSGRLLWRYRLAPGNEKIHAFGALQSRWPANTGALVDGSTVFVGAGLQLQPGSVVVALNTVTGQELWRNTTTGPKYNATTGVYSNATRVPTGYLTTSGTRLWARTFRGSLGGLSFDRLTGLNHPDVTLTSVQQSQDTLRGREIGVFGNQFLLWGGQDVYWDNVEREGKWDFAVTMLTNGVPRKPSVEIGTDINPAWNDQYLVGAFGTSRLECWNTPAAVDYFRSLVTNAAASAGSISRPEPTAPAILRWAVPLTNIHAVAIADNAAIVAVVTNKITAGKQTWTLVGGRLQAYSLTDGSRLWDTVLPAPPVRNAVSLDRNGAVLVTLHDGRVAYYAPTGWVPPTSAVDDAKTITAGSAATTVDVLANDAGQNLHVGATGNPQYGSVVNLTTGLSYTPQPGLFNVTDTFTYTAQGDNGTSNATVTVTVTATDNVGDNVPDSWRTQYFFGVDPTGKTTNALSCASCDPDGDGLTNRQEYRAGTDPNDARSTLATARTTTDAAGHITVAWKAIGGVRYRIQYSNGNNAGGFDGSFTDLVRSAGEETCPAVTGVSGTMSFTDDFTLTGGIPPHGARYYRVRTVP